MSDLEAKTKEFKKRLRGAVLTKEWLERTIISLVIYGRVSGVIGPYIIANLNGRMIIRLRQSLLSLCGIAIFYGLTKT